MKTLMIELEKLGFTTLSNDYSPSMGVVKVAVKDCDFTLILGKVAVWLHEGIYYLANPTDASYLFRECGAEPYTPSENDVWALSQYYRVWEKQVRPILDHPIFEKYTPCSEPPVSSKYWDCAKADYFGVEVCHSTHGYVQQYCGVSHMTRDEFITKMNEPSDPWIRVEFETESGARFVGDAGSDWKILI